MSSRKSNLKPQQTNIPQDKPAKGPPIDSIPFAKYTSIAGVHSSLLLFTALFLPQTSISAILDGQNFSQIGKRRDVGRILTEDPPRTLAWICLGAFILQAWWAGWVRGWLFDSKITVLGDNADGKLRRREWNDRKFAALWQACITTFAASGGFHILIVLFGAPLSSHFLHTYLLALQVALLAVFLPALVYGMPSLRSDTESLVRRMTWIRLFAEISPRSPIERIVVYPSMASLLGCWVGIIPIGLDWDRPWQAWPITPAYGAIIGCILGSLWALAVNGVLALGALGRESLRTPTTNHKSTPPQTKKHKSS